MTTLSKRMWCRRVFLALAVLSVWGCGVNMALHYWWDAAGNLLWAALAYWVSTLFASGTIR